jgi:hypothetical protein
VSRVIASCTTKGTIMTTELPFQLRLIGVGHILIGSDYPHVEGLTEPAAYLKDLQNFNYTPEQCRAVMRDNGLFLATRRPA